MEKGGRKWNCGGVEDSLWEPRACVGKGPGARMVPQGEQSEWQDARDRTEVQTGTEGERTP